MNGYWNLGADELTSKVLVQLRKSKLPSLAGWKWTSKNDKELQEKKEYTQKVVLSWKPREEGASGMKQWLAVFKILKQYKFWKESKGYSPTGT